VPAATAREGAGAWAEAFAGAFVAGPGVFATGRAVAATTPPAGVAGTETTEAGDGRTTAGNGVGLGVGVRVGTGRLNPPPSFTGSSPDATRAAARRRVAMAGAGPLTAGLSQEGWPAPGTLERRPRRVRHAALRRIVGG
jgi:hypothetical protein